MIVLFSDICLVSYFVIDLSCYSYICKSCGLSLECNVFKVIACIEKKVRYHCRVYKKDNLSSCSRYLIQILRG